MNTQRCTISLRIWHPTKPADVIVDGVGITPKITQTAGDKRTTPKGKELGGIYESSYCSFPLLSTEKSDSSVSDGLLSAIKMIDNCGCFFDEINQTGGKVEIFLGIFFHSNSGDEIHHDTLSDLGRLGVNLSLDLYCEDD
jgi:hypothetical protein